PEADITFCSTDGTHFQLQRKFLEANTGAFPGSEFDTRGEVVHLTESDCILRILFGFVHPRKHPDIEELSFPLLAGVAEAAEKYEIFSAINICKLQMRQFVPTNAVEVLAYATKHDHPTLIKEVAPHLARLPAIQIVEQLPTRYVVPWVRRLRCNAIVVAHPSPSLNIGPYGIPFSRMLLNLCSQPKLPTVTSGQRTLPPP
ncbi:hypothetical protein HYPSUDRAFT_147340, partial [Hypholoma sublateritium FD-334 SS-4]